MNHELPPVLRDHLDAVFAQAPDPARVVAAARLEIHTTPQQRDVMPRSKQRFPTMFSAAKFIFAGAIVALFGGFILTGLTPTSPRDGVEPAMGASASATAATTTTETDMVDTRVDRELVSGVDLEVEEVRPGVFRLLSDGHHDLTRDVWDVVVTPQGDVMVLRHVTKYLPGKINKDTIDRPRYRGAQVWQLGVPEAIYRAAEAIKDQPPSLDLADGQVSLRVGRADPVVWDGEGWHGSPDQTDCSGLLDAAGGCWNHVFDGLGDGFGHLNRRSADGTDQTFWAEDLGLTEGTGFGHPLAATEDGTVWTAYYDRRLAGLASYDGERWQLAPPDVPGTPPWGSRLAVAPDGTVWMETRSVSEDGIDSVTLSSWDGEHWQTMGPVEEQSVWRLQDIHFAADRSVWVGPGTYADGTTLRNLRIPASASNPDPQVRAYAYAPDGSIWVVVTDPSTPQELGCERNTKKCEGKTDGLYVITPEAVAASQ